MASESLEDVDWRLVSGERGCETWTSVTCVKSGTNHLDFVYSCTTTTEQSGMDLCHLRIEMCE